MKVNRIIETITSKKPEIRNRSVEELLEGESFQSLLNLARELEVFLEACENLYQRVRCCLFLFAIYRFYIPASRTDASSGLMPPAAARQMLIGNWEAAIRLMRPLIRKSAPDIVLSASAAAYYRLAFSYLMDQVHESISRAPGNEWIYQLASLDEYPLKVPEEYLSPDEITGLYPLGYDCCPVRIDPCHSGWSDIFFLAMDYPEGARVINFSVDIARRGTGAPRPPIECYSRIINRAVIRLVSLDLGCARNIYSTADLFDFEKDRLGLLKAGVIASGIVPPGFQNDPVAMRGILRKLVGPDRGIELVTRVHDLPPGSRMAVSTTLLAAIISRLMRQTGQITSPEGTLTDEERRIVASRAILGEWLGGSGGGWQDSGGLWPGIKTITGVPAGSEDPEYGVSRGRLLPDYRVLTREELPEGIDDILRKSIVLVHGGLSRDVGPVLELVTDKYLLRFRKEWDARLREAVFYDRIIRAIHDGDMIELGRLTTRDWENGTKKIIPWASDAYTEELIFRIKEKWGEDYRGFLMLGGEAGGGMAFIINPAIHQRFSEDMEELMKEVKLKYENALPFAMEPVVFDFTINHNGIRGELKRGSDALLPEEYYRFFISDPSYNPEGKYQIPGPAEAALALRRYSLPTGSGSPFAVDGNNSDIPGLPPSAGLLDEYGFDPELHRRNKELYQAGMIGLRENRLPRETIIRDAGISDVLIIPREGHPDFQRCRTKGAASLRRGEAAVVTLGAGLGSRWSGGEAVVKLLSPFVMIEGRHRSFLEIHLAKSARTSRDFGHPIQHAITTSFLTHRALSGTLSEEENYGSSGKVYLSPSLSTIQRLYPTEDDLREQMKPRLREIRDQESRRLARRSLDRLVNWISRLGPGEEFNLNTPIKRFYPAGHWYEIPNLIRNGTLGMMLRDNQNLRYLLVHNTDTLGAALDPVILGMHIGAGSSLSFEVLPRLWGDRGGVLAKVDGRVRIVEAGALPKPAYEDLFTYYNSLTTWIDIDEFLSSLWLTREDAKRCGDDPDAGRRVEEALLKIEERIPVYVTLKDTRYIWGPGQSVTAPVTQCERLWGDMTGLSTMRSSFIAVPRHRGRQLKDPDTLDNWVRDGSLDYLEGLLALRSARRILCPRQVVGQVGPVGLA
jgi:galactokinase/mevalonate kinase-like predicted kinase